MTATAARPQGIECARGVYAHRAGSTFIAARGVIPSPITITGPYPLIRAGLEPVGTCPVCWESVEPGSGLATPLGTAVHEECALCWACGTWTDESGLCFPSEDGEGKQFTGVLHLACLGTAYNLVELWGSTRRRRPRWSAQRRPAPGRYQPRRDDAAAGFRSEFPAPVVWSPYAVNQEASARYHVGTRCGICHWLDPDPTAFITCLGVPVHVDCAGCVGCGKRLRMAGVVWLSYDEEDGDSLQLFDLALHDRCFTRLYEPCPTD